MPSAHWGLNNDWIGHLITAFTMLMIHSWRIGSLDQWLDSARLENSVIEEENEQKDSQVEENEGKMKMNLKKKDELDIELVDIPDPVLEDDGFDD
ncbi:MAG: hypothetical protein Ct9H90mP16_21850 [Candidatus Poseidoniales archaeon]|nr:MAG: hypothetical protein Ct9H90mP16_21850 [Candidatus Poseidoniales archaeon]